MEIFGPKVHFHTKISFYFYYTVDGLLDEQILLSLKVRLFRTERWVAEPDMESTLFTYPHVFPTFQLSPSHFDYKGLCFF